MRDLEKNHLDSEEEEDEDGGRTSYQLYNYLVLEAATCRFSSRNKLGSGGFGTVYKVIMLLATLLREFSFGT
jgi:hypothetical protein